MKGVYRVRVLSIVLIAAYLLSACSGVALQSSSDPVGGGKALAQEVAFTGTVEALDSNEITVNGQTVSIDANTIVEPNIKVGDTVKVEAQVSSAGVVLALRVKIFGVEDAIPTVSVDETMVPEASETQEVTSTPDPSVVQTGAGSEKEVIGVVNDISSGSIAVDGVVYRFTSFTEIKGIISVGDMVKLHVIENADGSFTVREAEKVTGTGMGDDDDSNDDHGDDSNDDEHDDSSGNGGG